MGLTEKLRSFALAVFKPPVFESEAKTQQALVLYVNLWFAIICEVVVALMGLANIEMLLIHAASAAVNTLWFFFLLILTRLGRTVLASRLCIITILAITTVFALVGGGLHAPIISEYLVAIMVAGLLLGWRAGVWTMGASLAACAGFAWLEARGALPRNVVTYTPFSTLLLITLVFADIVMLLALTVYSIGRSYRRAERELLERMHAEKALREKTEELDRFFSFALDLLCIAGMDGCFKRLNPAWEATLGYTTRELENHRFLDFVHPEDLAATRAIVETLSRGLSISGFVNRYRCRDGSYRWIEWQAAPYQGRLIYAAARDITERRNAEEERARLDAQLQQSQKLESLGILAGGIAHDFNNLLAGIMGNAEIILSDLPEGASLRPMAGMVLEIAQRAAGLCTQMLAYSGRGMVTFEPLDLNHAVMEIGHILEASVSKKAEVLHDLAANLPAMEGDPTQVRQVVMNLVINAAESLEDKAGELRVSTGLMRCDREFLRRLHTGQDLRPGEYVYLEVQDTGHGMDEATQARIFDPFYSTKFTGRGLGLAAVLGIVRNHRGALRVESEPGKGTTFRVMFPSLAAPATVAEKAEAPADALWRGKGTVLLVDDESTIRIVGRNMLERLGFEVLVAENGERAVELYGEYCGGIQCVILDLTMPRMDGEETFRELRRLNCAAPIIITSGYSEHEVAERFAGRDVAGFLQKPYRMDNLKRILKNAFPA
jgi:PAS domain S-box-containing protein